MWVGGDKNSFTDVIACRKRRNPENPVSKILLFLWGNNVQINSYHTQNQ